MNREVQKKQLQLQKERQMKIEESLNYIMNDDRGRFFIAEIIGELTLAESNAFTGNSETFKNLGQQQVYIALKQRVLSVLGVNGFNAWQKMEKERYERMIRHEHR